MASASFRVAGLGGTFDHFHKGHERFILFAANVAQHLQIGITTQKLLLQKPLAELCQEYEVRVKAVSEFCERNKVSFEIIPLNDVYGPTLERSSLEALCVTTETLPGGELVNRVRKERGLPELPIHVCDYYLDELDRPLHSVGIRAGLVNREGRVYERILKNTVTLNQDQREFFARPQGRLMSEIASSPKESVFVVGDATLEYFIQHNLPYQLGVYDKKRNRAVVSSTVIDALRPDIAGKNTPGSISLELVRALESALQSKARHMFVEGEEDLVTVALVLLAPLQSFVYYGQSGKGMIEVRVTEEVKDRFYDVLSAR